MVLHFQYVDIETKVCNIQEVRAVRHVGVLNETVYLDEVSDVEYVGDVEGFLCDNNK